MGTESWTKSIIRGIICVTGIIGNNWLCISSLPKSMSQLRTNDILFVNLAVSNLITNYFVDVFNIFHTEQYIPVGKLFCGIHFFLPEFSQTSSIFTTLFITMYWYQKLVGSLKHGGAPVKMDNLSFITILLIGSWIFAFVISIPHIFFVAEDRENITITECEEELPSLEVEQAYKAVLVTLTNVFPLIGILYASIQIAVTLLQNEKRMRKMSTADNTNNVSTVTKSKSQSKSGSLVRAAKSVLAVAIFFLICWVIHLVVKILTSVSEYGVIDNVESFVGASYSCIIPYIYLYGVQKLTCCKC